MFVLEFVTLGILFILRVLLLSIEKLEFFLIVSIRFVILLHFIEKSILVCFKERLVFRISSRWDWALLVKRNIIGHSWAILTWE